jgi:hypothetical protein
LHPKEGYDRQLNSHPHRSLQLGGGKLFEIQGGRIKIAGDLEIQDMTLAGSTIVRTSVMGAAVPTRDRLSVHPDSVLDRSQNSWIVRQILSFETQGDHHRFWPNHAPKQGQPVSLKL